MTPAIEHVARLVCERQCLDPDELFAGPNGRAHRRVDIVAEEVRFIQQQLRAWEVNYG